jgi:hypothetical protein
MPRHSPNALFNYLKSVIDVDRKFLYLLHAFQRAQNFSLLHFYKKHLVEVSGVEPLTF